jgi:hypothetical protein
MLTAVSLVKDDVSDTWWLCKCDCGNELKRRSHHLRSRGGKQSCGCFKNERPIKYAVLVDDDLLTINQLSERFGMPRHVLRHAAEAGHLTRLWIDEWLHKRWRLDMARKLGLSNHTLYQRRKKHGDVDSIYTTPLQQGMRKDMAG